MRVILNGVSALKPKTGVGHTTVNLHTALVESSRGDEFWLFPGSLLSRAASRLLGRKPKTSPRVATERVPGKASLRSSAVSLAKAAYRESFRVAARWGRFDLYHEPNFVPIRTHLPTVATVHDLSVVLHPEWHPADRVAQGATASVQCTSTRQTIEAVDGSDKLPDDLVGAGW